MENLRYWYHVIADTGSALLLALSVGAGASILGASVTQTVRGGLVGGLLGTLVGGAGFGVAVWRTHRSPSHPGDRLAA
jgi:hypothetical protein